MSTGSLPVRARAAVAATRIVNMLSRQFGAGSGTVAGGHAGLAIDPRLLERLAAGRRVALLSGTNGKTTTTRLVVVAVEGALGRAATNATGSNMPTGHVTALAGARPGSAAVLEVDEGYLPHLVESLEPEVVVLLNLSRDQLDRTNEVRMVAEKWRAELATARGTAVVANADDPLVTWAASASAKPVWVGAGLAWREDAVGCPSCEGRIAFASAGPTQGWACTCGFSRPGLDVRLEEDEVVLADGRRLPVALRLPGRFNRANAVMAGAAAAVMGVDWDESLRRMADVDEVAGRFSVLEVGGCRARVMLAKNPAGWRELLDLVCPGARPVVVGINARVADGRDPSWLWDVPFERLRGRQVVATGERCRDLAVRLHYAEVPHRTVRDEVAAVRAARTAADNAQEAASGTASGSASGSAQTVVDFIGNYTAFTDLAARAAAPARGGA
ncbi:MAG: MurT ligase domain-containing protein [Nitrososphaerales archaeon]